VLGLAYKPNTHDTRESPSVPICQSLLDLGAEVRAADPHVHARDVPPGVVLVDAIDEEVDAADLVVVLVDHAAFGLPDLLDRVPHVLDTRGCMPRDGRFEHL
jgi:UDP-N-acetyl-D-mannosaminuronic acid dehydrogenase/UDP-N-acetyl-D-glucosamine dehydrogenase